MADCTCNPEYLLKVAEFSLSDSLFDTWSDQMFKNFCPNPFLDGRSRTKKSWRERHNTHANKLIWC